MLHHLQTMRLAPDGREGRWRDRLWACLETVGFDAMRGHGQELVGAWLSPIGSGRSNELTLLWSVVDRGAWAGYVDTAGGLLAPGSLREWRGMLANYALEVRSRLLLSAPAWDLTVLGRHAAGGPTGAVAPGGSVWQIEYTDFAPDGRGGRWRQDYWPEFRTRLAPTLERLGVDLIGAWATAPGSGNADEHVFLYRTADFDSWGAYLERIAGAGLDPVLRERRSEMWVWREQWYTSVLLPAPPHAVSLLGAEVA